MKILKSSKLIFLTLVLVLFFVLVPKLFSASHNFIINGPSGTGQYISGVGELFQTSVAPGETFTVYGYMEAYSQSPSPGSTNVSLKVKINTTGQTFQEVFPLTQLYFSQDPHQVRGGSIGGLIQLVAPTTPGNYALLFEAGAFTQSSPYINSFIIPFTVTSGGSISVSVSASPEVIKSPQTSTISWISQNANNCTLKKSENGGSSWTNIPISSTSGSKTVSPNPNVNTTYRVTCSRPGGTPNTDYDEVIVKQITLSLEANPNPTSTESTVLSWEATNADSCTLKVGDNNPVPVDLSSTGYTVGISGSTEIQMTCTRSQDIIAGYCTGNFTAQTSSCAGSLVGNYCQNGNTPTGSCSQFTVSECLTPSDPWCHHACYLQTSYTSNLPCTGIPQAICGDNNHEGCQWVPSSTIPGDSITKVVTVTEPFSVVLNHVRG